MLKKSHKELIHARIREVTQQFTALSSTEQTVDQLQSMLEVALRELYPTHQPRVERLLFDTELGEPYFTLIWKLRRVRE